MVGGAQRPVCDVDRSLANGIVVFNLAEEWPDFMSGRRVDPPHSVKQRVLAEAGYRCGNPRCNNVITLQIHHIVWVKDGGGNDPSNLLALCAYCHDLHTQGHIKIEAIRLWKGLLLALNNAFDRPSMDALRMLYSAGMIHVSGDGLLRLAGLIVAGLVVRGVTMPASQGSFTFTYGVYITEKGKQLVDAWLAGDEERYRLLLMSPTAGVDA